MADNQEIAEVNKKKEFDKKKGILIAGIAVGVLLLIYGILSVYFLNHFAFRTKINGVGVSGCSLSKAQDKMKEEVASYDLNIVCSDGTKVSIPAEEFELTLDEKMGDEAIRELLNKQNGFAWIIKLFAPDHLQLDTSSKEEGNDSAIVKYDQKKLLACLKKQPFMDKKTQTPPENAKLSEYDPENGFSLIEAKEGTRINQKNLLLAIDEALKTMDNEVNLSEDGCYQRPAVDNDNEELLTLLDTVNQYAKSVINYEIGEKGQTLDASVFADWLIINNNCKVKFDKEKVAAYVSEIAKTYNTCYSAKTLMTSYGKEVSIPNSHYGWKVDEEAETAQIIKDIKQGKEVTRDLNYSMTANSHGDQDYGDSYVEINLTAQHLFLHKDGKVVLETDFVSGNTSRGNGTPTGAFTLTYRQKDAVLRGVGYATRVKYWMPFFGNYGMHDASWRSNFGGKIYKTNGSHGCVNLPPSIAPEVYENIEKGWPVLIYELEGTEAKPQEDKEEEKTQEDQTEEEYQEDIRAAEEVDDAIAEAVKETITLEREKEIAKLRKQYEALSKKAKEFVKNEKKLQSAEKKLEKLKKTEEKIKEKEAAKKEAEKKKEEAAKKKEEAAKKKEEAAKKEEENLKEEPQETENANETKKTEKESE